MGETGKRALTAAHARQPSQLLVSKLAHGSAASVTDARDRTPLYYAEYGGHAELAALLRKRMAAGRGSDQ